MNIQLAHHTNFSYDMMAETHGVPKGHPGISDRSQGPESRKDQTNYSAANQPAWYVVNIRSG